MKIVCSLATFRGREDSLKTVLESLKNQTVIPDEIFVYNNEVFPDLTDNGKFWFLTQMKEPVFFFSMDDDIKYPPDYIEKTLAALKKHPKSVITYHGRILVGKGMHYYKAHTKLRCTLTVKKDTVVDVGGSGVSCFNTKHFNPTEICSNPDRKMADLTMSYEAAKKGVSIICKKHSGGWIVGTGHIGYNINNEQYHNCGKQGQYADKIIDLKNK